MSFLQTLWPMKSVANNVKQVNSVWVGGGAASDMTVVLGQGRGIDSIKYNAATGAYNVLFTNVGKTFLGVQFTFETAGSTATQLVCSAQAMTGKTMPIFITDLATPTAKDLLTTQKIYITATWSDSEMP